MKRKKILITGSAGQAGSAIVRLLSSDYELIGIDRVKGQFTTVVADLNDWTSIKQISRGVSAIIHTASLHAPHVNAYTRADFVDTNIKGTLHLLEAAKANKVNRFIYTSTTSVYGAGMENRERAVWVTEKLQPIARDIYDITKLTAEALCKDFSLKEQLQTLSLRVSRFWDEPLPDKVFYRMFRGVDVRDVAAAHQLALNANPDCFEIFNISAQSNFEETDLYAPKHDLSHLLALRYPAISNFFKTRGWALPRSIDRVYVIDKAKEMLGFRPLHNADNMIAELSGHSLS